MTFASAVPNDDVDERLALKQQEGLERDHRRALKILRCSVNIGLGCAILVEYALRKGHHGQRPDGPARTAKAAGSYQGGKCRLPSMV